jgi:hypothetical protein
MSTQTHLKTWTLTKKLSGWLAVFALALAAVVVATILLGKELRVSEILPPLLLAVFSFILRGHAVQRVRESGAARLARETKIQRITTQERGHSLVL